MPALDEHETERTVGERFADVAAAYPGHEAVADPDCSWTYAELEARTRVLAARLVAAGAGPGSVVAVLLPTGVLHVAWVLAVLRAGAAYVSLDPTYPDNRLRLMLGLAGPVAVVATADLHARAAALGADRLLDAGVDRAEPPDASAALPTPCPESFACLYFTSGSTGVPKAVVHTHRNLRFDLNRQARDLAVTPGDRFDLLFSPSFSAFLAPVFGALLGGASVHVLDLRAHSVERLRDWLRERRITVCTIGVSTLRRLAGACPEGHDLPDLRVLSVGAEPLLPADLRAVRARLSGRCLVQNAFATTETRTIVQAFFGPGDPVPEVVTLGRPVEGKRVELLDERGQPVPPGAAGEVVVTSPFISPGTWERLRGLPGGRVPALEDRVHRTGDLARFTEDGTLVHLGRTDQQLKVRGHRVDAGEIESRLLAHPAVASAAAFLGIASAGDAEPSMLVAAWTRRPGAAASVGDLRGELAADLPSYAVPAVLWEVAALPMTETGKLARRRLPGLWAASRPVAEARPVPPGGAAQADDTPARLWRSVLGIDSCGEDDDFAALGGDSMGMVLLAEGASRLLGRTVPASALVGTATLRRFRALLGGAHVESPVVAGLVLRRLPGPRPGTRPRTPLVLLPPWGHSAVLFRDLAAQPFGRREPWALEGTGPRGEVEPPAFTLGETAHRVALAVRAAFGDGPVDLAGFSAGGLVAVEAASLLELRGTRVGRVHLLDASRLHGGLDGREAAWRRLAAHRAGRLALSLVALASPEGPPRLPLLERLVVAKPRAWLRGSPANAARDPYLAAYEANVAMTTNHRVIPCPCPVVLHRCDDQDAWYNLLAPELGWRVASPHGLRVVRHRCGHADLLRGAHAARAARVLDGD